MAKLNDLPAELVRRIIAYVLDQCYCDNIHHHDLDHNEIGEFAQKPRPHLADKSPYDMESRQFPSTTPTDEDEMVNVAPVSWPDGLPSNPLLPFSLINHTFRRCAQEKLFNNVGLRNQQQANLFFQALSGPTPEGGSELPRGSIGNHEEHNSRTSDVRVVSPSAIATPSSSHLALYVRSLQFTWTAPCSMEQGGSLICEIVRSCPLIENIAISPTFLMCCKEPILEALASRQRIKEFVVLGRRFERETTDTTVFKWLVDELPRRLFSKWDLLESIEFFGLSRQSFEITETIPQPIPVMNHKLKVIILNDPDLDERTLSWMLKGSMESLRTFKIVNPNSRLDRRGLYRILTECTSPDLESLALEVDWSWNMIKRSAEGSDDPALNSALMDLVFKSSSALRKLKTLSITGTLVGSESLKFLPQSLVKLAWDECWELPSGALVKVLSSDYQSESPGELDTNSQWLPNLKCLSVRDDNKWHCRDRKAVEEALKARGVCFHPICGRSYGSQFDDDGPIVDPMRNIMASQYW
ncbi:hypothetical protein PTTG_11761 [Puccinia triticina 1-1 BBBD Race 1]|uniref:Uncharacterized protein n=1 Tax=Puccinia triticina (isolate 1-1 / race 1 (BBBD)) TaxID=630390 RepID=A0A180GM54_PUCT1|nr:hypothetical protein PTTG_11761 [Puccinia triticina 1-1 BBBD Race 1]